MWIRAPDIKAQTNRTTTVTQGYDSKGNVIHTITNSSGVVTGNQKAVARSIHGGAGCGPCSIAQVEAGVVNVTGVQVKVGGNGRRFPK